MVESHEMDPLGGFFKSLMGFSHIFPNTLLQLYTKLGTLIFIFDNSTTL